jgi:hypothetical protein
MKLEYPGGTHLRLRIIDVDYIAMRLKYLKVHSHIMSDECKIKIYGLLQEGREAGDHDFKVWVHGGY